MYVDNGASYALNEQVGTLVTSQTSSMLLRCLATSVCEQSSIYGRSG